MDSDSSDENEHKIFSLIRLMQRQRFLADRFNCGFDSAKNIVLKPTGTLPKEFHDLKEGAITRNAFKFKRDIISYRGSLKIALKLVEEALEHVEIATAQVQADHERSGKGGFLAFSRQIDAPEKTRLGSDLLNSLGEALEHSKRMRATRSAR